MWQLASTIIFKERLKLIIAVTCIYLYNNKNKSKSNT